MATSEIEEFLIPITEEFLERCMMKIGKLEESTKKVGKTELSQIYQTSVLEVGINGLVDKLDPETHKLTCAAIGLPSTTGSSELASRLIKISIHSLIDNADENLLKKLCYSLKLEHDMREIMQRQIEDEVMLTGAESFLRKLQEDLLKEHCRLANLPDTGSVDELVDRLMVAMFNLEPKDEKKKKKKEGAGAAKVKFVAPPLETIKQGKYRTYQELYDNFNLPDLVNFCKQESIKVSKPKKKDVIKSILTFLETGEKGDPKTAKKRKSPAGTDKSAKKQKTDSNGNDDGDQDKEMTSPTTQATNNNNNNNNGNAESTTTPATNTSTTSVISPQTNENGSAEPMSVDNANNKEENNNNNNNHSSTNDSSSNNQTETTATTTTTEQQ